MVRGHSRGRESWKSWTLDMLMWEQCRIKPVYEQIHMPAADDADLLMRCFGCATGGDQVFYSALSATDLSHLARSASVTLQLEMWSPSSIAHDRKWKERVNKRLKNEKPKMLAEHFDGEKHFVVYFWVVYFCRACKSEQCAVQSCWKSSGAICDVVPLCCFVSRKSFGRPCYDVRYWP